MAMSKRTNNDLQSTTQKTKDQGTRTQLKTGVTAGALEELAVPLSFVTHIFRVD